MSRTWQAPLVRVLICVTLLLFPSIAVAELNPPSASHVTLGVGTGPGLDETPTRLRITGTWIDTSAGVLTIVGQNLKNGPELLVLLDDLPLFVDQDSAIAWNNDMIRARLPRVPVGEYLLGVRTGPVARQYDATHVRVGEAEVDPLFGASKSDGTNELDGSWKVLATPLSDGDIRFEVIEDYVIDLRPYFDNHRSLACPAGCWNHITDKCSQVLCPRRAYFWTESGAERFKAVVSGWGPIDTEFIRIAHGHLTMKKGYRWDGPSIPKWLPYPAQDIRRWNRASAVHDVLYDLMRDEILPRPSSNDAVFPLLNRYNNRLTADQLIYMLARIDGQEKIVARSGFWLIRAGGYARLSDENPDWKIHAVPEIGERITCAPRNGLPVTLDATASRFQNSLYWTDNGAVIPMTTGIEQPSVTLDPGQHAITLAVTHTGLENDWAKAGFTLFVEADETAPLGSITAPLTGTCTANPVTVRDDFTDACDDTLSRAYVPGPGPVYAAQGDYDVQLTVTDNAGNSAIDSVRFTIDQLAPTVDLLHPSSGTQLPALLPFTVLFTASDDDGAAGGVVHEAVTIDDCVVFDGWDYGAPPNGLLSDDTLTLDRAALCNVAQRCGWTQLHDPTLRVTATDCAGNAGTDAATLDGSLSLVPGICAPALGNHGVPGVGMREEAPRARRSPPKRR